MNRCHRRRQRRCGTLQQCFRFCCRSRARNGRQRRRAQRRRVRRVAEPVVDSADACYLRGQLALHAIFLLETDTRMLKEGDRAPAFTAATDSGTALSLASLRGRRVILYFYPKDDTSGCTLEACEFRDAFPRFEGLAATVI